MKILRKELVKDEISVFEFDVKCFSFSIKNLTSDDILVCFGQDFDLNSNIKIPTYTSQIITENIVHSDSKYAHTKIAVKALGEGEVEIQCLEY